MYTFNISPKRLKDEILELLTEYDIYEYYIGSKFPITKKFKSPLRDDSNPSFSIFISTVNRKLLFKDFGTGVSGDCFTFVQHLFNISYPEALQKIKNDIINNNIKPSDKGKAISEKYNPKHAKIEIKIREFSDADIEYWSQYAISLDTLNKYKVFPTSSVWIDGELKLNEKELNPIYSYLVFDKFKIYRPFNIKYKWVSNTTSYDIQGYQQLPEQGDLLIITKSLKDVMCLHELGYNAIACPSENTIIPSIIFENINQRFTNILVFYDNDDAGIKGAEKMKKIYNTEYITIPYKEYKDISDYIKSKGIDNSKKLITDLCQTFQKSTH